jgi:hypothetical protein
MPALAVAVSIATLRFGAYRMSFDSTVLGALVLLVLPPLAALCVLATGPVADAIGRRQHEEEQVVRAPVVVAGLALLLEVLVAAFLRQAHGVGQELRLAVGAGALWVDRYAVIGVLAVSLAMLAALVGAEATRPRDTKISTLEVASLLLLWAAQVAVMLAGMLRTVASTVALAGVAVSVALLLSARREARPARLALTAAAVGGPIIVWLLLRPLAHLDAGPDISEASGALRQTDPATVHAALGGLWLAGVAFPALAVVLLALAPQQRIAGAGVPAALVAATMAGALPALFRVTVMAFPAGSPIYALEWLSPRLGWTAALLGVAALALVQARVSLWHRVSLTVFGQICLLTWCLAHFTPSAAHLGLAVAAIVGLTLPVYFAQVASLDRAAGAPWLATGSRLSRAARLLEVCVFLPWGLIIAVSAPGGVVLVALVLAAGVRLGIDLRRAEPPRPRAGLLPPGKADRVRFGLELAAALVWVLIALAVGAHFAHVANTLAFLHP